MIFSFEAFKKYSPDLSANYRHVTKAEKTEKVSDLSQIGVVFDADKRGPQ